MGSMDIPATQTAPFSYIGKYPPAKLLYVLRQEPAETIAVLLCYMDPGKAAEILENLDPSIQGDVVKCISFMANISP